MPTTPALSFAPGDVDSGDGAWLAQAMRAEIAVMYAGLDLDGDTMPKAGAAELSPPGGPKQGNAAGLYRAEGYAEIPEFNGNPVAVFSGEKRLEGRP
jgi:hypothetical protein